MTQTTTEDDTDNYRPKQLQRMTQTTTLSNCLGKLFNTILYNRLQNEIQKNIVLSSAHAGFGKDHRTSDHILTLFSLINKYIKKREILVHLFCRLPESI